MKTVVDCTGYVSLASHLFFYPSVSSLSYLYLRRLEVKLMSQMFASSQLGSAMRHPGGKKGEAIFCSSFPSPWQWK